MKENKSWQGTLGIFKTNSGNKFNIWSKLFGVSISQKDGFNENKIFYSTTEYRPTKYLIKRL